ncbi:hypothetical protein [Alkaliphilus hydrothermalis]|uniref:Uncharacterized protein n=1 Tax=Alkaliphilus hydrothermalis TaxID=1482730 RepID=A0ABS2NP26_9FIRM|nr:hypothetical protein [Alkaliphilus hydrothermalis]MBM7614698.1 hypothetical protein [Alkaliphilus hydrothermalis]
MSYVLVENKMYDSEEILNRIKEKHPFKVVKDITKGSKRDDTLVYQIIHDVVHLKEEILLDTTEPIEQEDLVEELMNLADEKVAMIEDLLSGAFICYSYSYHYDDGLEEIKSIFIACDESVGDLRLSDIAERILKSID